MFGSLYEMPLRNLSGMLCSKHFELVVVELQSVRIINVNTYSLNEVTFRVVSKRGLIHVLLIIDTSARPGTGLANS